MDTSTPLVPQPKVGLRLTILAGLTVLVWLTLSPWHAKLGIPILLAGLLGTYPCQRISADYFERQWHIFFARAHCDRVRIVQVRQIETDVEWRIGLMGGCALSLLVGLQNVLMVWLLDWLIPWAGGDYMLWLRLESDERILAWQGNGESNFRRNLEILEAVSHLPVARG